MRTASSSDCPPLHVRAVARQGDAREGVGSDGGETEH
jgi:hypothetical protein